MWVVQLFEGLDRVLPVEDADISKAAARGFKKQGIEVHTKTFVTDVVSGDASVTFKHGEEQGEADVDGALMEIAAAREMIRSGSVDRAALDEALLAIVAELGGDDDQPDLEDGEE